MQSNSLESDTVKLVDFDEVGNAICQRRQNAKQKPPVLTTRTALGSAGDTDNAARPSKHHEDAPNVQIHYSTFMAYFPYAILEVYFYAETCGSLYPRLI